MKQPSSSPTTKDIFINKFVPSFIKGMNQALTVVIVGFIFFMVLKVF